MRTPLLPVDALSERFPAGVWVKPEMLQRTGAFKFRGAYTFLSGMSAADRARGVIAPSSGNHGQAVAYAARMYGVPCTVVMPTTVTAAKRAGAERSAPGSSWPASRASIAPRAPRSSRRRRARCRPAVR